MRKVFLGVWLALGLAAARGQARTGEVRVAVTDAQGLAVRASVVVTSLGNGYRAVVSADEAGKVDVPRLAYGVYRVTVNGAGFGTVSRMVEVRGAAAVEYGIRLVPAAVNTTVEVRGDATLVDPGRVNSAMRVGAREIEDRVGSLPGRSVQDMVNSQPGWLYEGNAVLHPRGSEYQTQFVVDGVPLTDNRSPSFGPEIEADDVEAMSIYTAGIPAEYGRKMGGVVELTTKRELNPGVHGVLALSGGSYGTAQGYGQVQDRWGGNTVGVTASGSRTEHYLNPVVPENYTNRGTTGDFSVRYEREVTAKDRVTASVRHELARFEVPNEQVQEDAGQLQTRDNLETMGTVGYQHTFSADTLGTLAGMVRDNANDLFSNAKSTPIAAFQNNSFREGYFKGTVSWHRGVQEIKAGVESDATMLRENFRYAITDATQFDEGTPGALSFADRRLDLEQSGFAEDVVRLGKWTVSAGLRYDHYQLLVNEFGFSPRVSVGRSVPRLRMVVHGSYDRVFQTPSFENILISSSTAMEALNSNFLRLPVRPSRGDYFEGGVTEGFSDRVRMDVNVYRRTVRGFADDDQLLNTGVSYPISFSKGRVYGAEGKLEVVRAGALTGFVSYSYMVGKVFYPVSGGLFLGDDASAAAAQGSGHFPDTQDQRNTVRTRFRYQMGPRVWAAAGAAYGSGLPFAFGGDPAEALAEYGPEVISRVNFARGRVRPSLTVNTTVGVDVYRGDRVRTRFQADGDNLNGRLNVVDFGGLFSGNAIEPGRSFGLRLTTSF